MADWVQINETKWLNMDLVQGAYDAQDVLSLYVLPTGFLHWLFHSQDEQFTGDERARILRYLGTKNE